MRYSKWLILLLFFSCDFTEPSPDDPRIKEEVQKKINRRITESQNDCIQAATSLAEVAVDSTLRVMALDEKLLIYNPPDKPLKPNQPIVPVIQDSSPIEPLQQRPIDIDTLVNQDSVIIKD